MADFDPEAYAAEPAAPPTAAPVFNPEAYAGGDDEAAPENMGVMRPPPPLEQPHTDPAVVDAIRARVAARVAGDPLPPETPALAHFRDNNAALATYKAGASGLSSADGQEALQRADATGLGPEHVAKNLAAVRKQDDASTLKTALSGAPILASFAAQSPAHAAAVKDDAANLSFLEWLFRGVPQTKTVQSWDGSYTVQQDTGEDIIPPAAEQFFAKGMLSLKAAYLGVREQIQRNTDALRAQAEKDGLKGADPSAQFIGRTDLDLKAQRAGRETPEERAAADDEIAGTQELAGAEVPGTSGSLAREMTGASIEALPQLAGLAAAPAPFLFAQTMGSLHNHFSLAKNDDGSPRFTDDQARDLALGGATATTAILGGLGKKLASNTIGKLLPKAAQDSMAEAGANSFVRRLASSPALSDRLLGHAVQFKDAMVHGIAFMLGQSVIENLTDQTGNVMTGGKFDASKVAQAAEDSIDGAMDLLPLVALEPVRSSVLDTGRAIRAHLDGAHVAAAVEAAKESQILASSPDQVRPLLEAQTSADPSKATAYVPVEAFDAAMAKEGHDPAEIASSLSDQGASYQEAKVGSGDVAVPMADVLGKLAPAGLADGLLPDLKLDPDPQAMTPRQAMIAANENSGSLSYRPAASGMTGRLSANAPKVEPLVVARALREAAEQAEPQVSAALKALESDHAKLIGFGARLKGEGRIADKIREALIADPDLTPATATDKVKDPLRYTLQVAPEQYAGAVSDALKKLEAQGFSVDKFKNYWGGEIYQGVNVAMRTPTGERMELQFHTPDSYAALKTTHLPYEEYRRADTSPERMQELHAQMADVQSGIAPPPGALGFDFASDKPGAKAPAPSPLAAARSRAKNARDLDTALQAYAWDRVSKLKLAEIRPATYRSRAQLAALKMAELARATESAQQGLQRTKVITPQNHAGEPATYKLVEANDLVTSHTPNSFSPEARYPAGIQERDYLGQQGEQNKVANGAKNLNPALVLADSPTAVDGPPLVTSGPNAYVLGGNGRSMMLRRAYLDGDAGQRYKDALRAKAAHFGIEPSAVDAMKQPVLVRSIDAIPDTAGRAEMTAAVRRYNEGLTQQFSPRLRAVAESKVLTPRTVESIAEILGKGDSSLRDLLRDKPQEFQAILERDGVINNENRAQFVRMGELTDEAKDRIEGMFLGKIMGSGERLEATPPSMTRKVERVAASLLRVAGQLPAADEIGDVQGALDLLNDAKRRGMPLDDLLSQVALPGEKPVEAAPRTVAMARLIADKGQKDLGARFKAWAEALAPEKQKGLFAAKPATPEEALKTLFAGEQVDLSGESRKADAAREAKGTAKGPTFELNEQAAKNEAKVKIAKERLSEIQMQHRLNDHMAEAAESFKAEAAKIRDALNERSTVTARNVLAQADREVDPQSAPAYTDAHDAIMQALGFQPLSGTPKSIDAGVARIAADDRLNFDPDALKQILAKAPGRQMALGRPITGSIDGLTLDEAKLVKTAVENIRHAARAAIEVTRDEKRATYADDVRQIREFSASLGKRPPGPPSPSNAGKGAGESAARLLKAVHTGMLKPEVLLRELGPVGEAYFREYLKSRARAEEFSRVIGERMQKALDSMPKEILDHRFDKIAPPRVGNGPDGQPILNPDKWTRQDAMMLFAWAGTDSSMERAAKGLGTNEGELHRFFDQLSKAEKDFVQSAIWDVNDQVLKPALVDQTARSTGTPMDTIEARPITTKDGQYRGGFHHASYNREASQRAQARSVFQPDGVGDYYGDLKSGWAVGPASGFTKARVAGAADVPDLNWSSYPAHVAAVTHYLAVDDFVKAFGGLLRRADARAAIAASPIGSEGLKQLDEFLKTEASGGREAPQGGFAEANRIAGSVIRSRAAQAVFTVNIKTWLQQFSHVIAAAPGLRLGPASVLYGLAKAGTGTIASLAGFTGEHLLHGMGEAMRPYSWAAARDASERYGDNELGYRWDRFTDKQRELFGNVGPGQKAGPVGRVVDAMNWTGFHVIDGFLSQWIWHAADLKNRAVPMEQRARLNDQAVRDAMPPMALSELSSFARDRGFIGSMLLTKRFQNTLYNLQEIGTWQSRTEAFGANSQGLQRAVAITGYAANAWLTYQAITMGAHLVGRYLGGHGRKKDEGETTPQWIARQWLVGNAYPFPFGEELATPLVEHVVDHKPLDRRAITDSLMRTNPPLNWVVDEYSDVGDALTSHKPIEDRAWKGIRALLRVTPTASPLPLINQVRSGTDLLRGKTKARGPFDAGSKFTYAPRPGHTETNPLSDISRAIGE